jgi:hypothetical protein
MLTPEFITPPRHRFDEERQSALSYWGTGVACLAAMVFIFWLSGLNF